MLYYIIMKALTVIAILATLLVPSVAPTHAQNSSLNITVDIPFIASLAREIAGPEVDITTLLSSTDSPHTFSLRPRSVRALQNADLVVTVSEALSPNITRTLKNVADVRVVNLATATGIDTLSSRGQHDHGAHNDNHADEHTGGHGDNNSSSHKDEHHEERKTENIDPHIWLSPANVQVMVTTLRDELITVAPLQAELFKQSANNMIEMLQEFDEQQKKRWADTQNRSFVSLHDATYYFENHYQLNSQGSLFGVSHVSPGVLQLNEIKKILKAENVNCVVADALTPAAWIDTLSEGSDVNVVSIDVLGFDPSDAHYLTTLRQISDSFAQCLGVTTE